MGAVTKMPRQRVNAPGPTPEVEVPMPDQPNICACGCDQPIPPRLSHRYNGTPKFLHGHNRTRPPSVRFWEKVDKDDPGGCWIWRGATGHAGYGVFRGPDRNVGAHRFAYEDVAGPIPEGLELDHLCRTPLCVNPAHLEPVTHAENMARGSIAAKTHCKHGHAYTSENTGRNPNGTRYCRACNRERYHRRRAS